MSSIPFVMVSYTGSSGSALKSPVMMTGTSFVRLLLDTNSRMSFPCSFLRVERRAPLRALRWVVATHNSSWVDLDLRCVIRTTWKKLQIKLRKSKKCDCQAKIAKITAAATLIIVEGADYENSLASLS